MSDDSKTPSGEAEIRSVEVPDIGDLDKVEVIEILVETGQQIEVEDPLITLESDKASMDVPSPLAGEVTEVLVSLGDEVGEGAVIAKVRVGTGTAEGGAASDEEEGERSSHNDEAPEGAARTEDGKKAATVEESKSPSQDEGEDGSKSSSAAAAGKTAPRQSSPSDSPRLRSGAAEEEEEQSGASFDRDHDYDFDLVVLGSGPGGYTAAFRAADLGLRVALVERYPSLGGVCLNVGCIPSKSLLHAAAVLDEARESEAIGLSFGEPAIDLDRLREWKNDVVGKLTGGLAGMSKQRGVEVITGRGELVGAHELEITPTEHSGDGAQHDGEGGRISFARAILAAGSQSVQLPFLPNDDPRVFDSTGALELREIPDRLLVIGGGIIGLEMATVYLALGSRVSIVEMMDGLMIGADRDLVRPLQKRLAPRLENVWLETKVTAARAQKNGIKVELEGKDAPSGALFDAVLVAVGRVPNGRMIGAEAAGVEVDERGFIPTDDQMRTNVAHIFAIGDLTHGPMLAHKATHEGKAAAEVAAGHKSGFEARVIPSVAYTDPEVAWVGVTEAQAKEEGLEVEKGVFPWAASGRALAMHRSEGTTKLLFHKQTGRLLGGGIVGPNAGDLISEVALAIEMNCDAEDIGLTVHPHPTLSETVAFAAEAYEGTITDLYLPKQKKRRQKE